MRLQNIELEVHIDRTITRVLLYIYDGDRIG